MTAVGVSTSVDPVIDLYQDHNGAKHRIATNDDRAEAKLDSRLCMLLQSGGYTLRVRELVGDPGKISVAARPVQRCDPPQE